MLLIDASMPVQCVSCPLWAVTTIRNKLFDVCRKEHCVIEDPYSVPKWCPLKEIPPHGDLIDRTVLKTTLAALNDCHDGHSPNTWGEVLARLWEMWAAIDAVPVVIPAEQET